MAMKLALAEFVLEKKKVYTGETLPDLNHAFYIGKRGPKLAR